MAFSGKDACFLEEFQISSLTTHGGRITGDVEMSISVGIGSLLLVIVAVLVD